MAIALDPNVATRTHRCFVAIETASTLCRGQSVVDHLHLMGRDPNAEVIMEASREKFLQMLFDFVPDDVRNKLLTRLTDGYQHCLRP
jgi:purine nucleosidase